MEADEIAVKMTEHRAYDVTRNEVVYRWDFGIHHVTDKCYPINESTWIAPARARAAARIAKMREQHV